MTLPTNTLAAFQTASGESATAMSLDIRISLIVMIFIWAAWCLLGEIQHMKHHDLNIERLLFNIFRVSFLTVLSMALVFI